MHFFTLRAHTKAKYARLLRSCHRRISPSIPGWHPCAVGTSNQASDVDDQTRRGPGVRRLGSKEGVHLQLKVDKSVIECRMHRQPPRVPFRDV